MISMKTKSSDKNKDCNITYKNTQGKLWKILYLGDPWFILTLTMDPLNFFEVLLGKYLMAGR